MEENKFTGDEKITKIEIKGLWNRYDLEWNVNEDVNILSGINGSGKTTIFNYIINFLIENIEYFLKKYIQIADIIITFNNNLQISSKLYFDEVEKISNIIEKKRADIKDADFALNPIKYSPNIYIITLSHKIDIQIISTFENNIDETSNRKNSQPKNEEIKTDLDLEVKELQEKYLNYQVKLGKRVEKALLKNDRKAYKSIYAKKQLFIKTINDLFAQTNKKIDIEENRISFLDWQDKELSPYKLSSGEKQLLIILIKALIQDNKPTILFMDEPEISLHIEWQKVLIEKIRELNPNTQIFIATHSPALIMKGWLDKVSEMSDLIVKDRYNG